MREDMDADIDPIFFWSLVVVGIGAVILLGVNFVT
jgi:hypothetical protein